MTACVLYGLMQNVEGCLAPRPACPSASQPVMVGTHPNSA